jgi:hypothetical protein
MLGTSIVVGTQDVMGVELDELLVIPADAKVPTPPRDQKNYEPGPLGVRFASISGRAVDEATGEPLDAGRVIVNRGLAYSLNSEGRFEIRRVLPGQYSLEIWAFGVGSIVKVIDVDDGDIELDFKLGGRTP